MGLGFVATPGLEFLPGPGDARISVGSGEERGVPVWHVVSRDGPRLRRKTPERTADREGPWMADEFRLVSALEFVWKSTLLELFTELEGDITLQSFDGEDKSGYKVRSISILNLRHTVKSFGKTF